MSLKLPENVIDTLNEAGFGGRYLYVPLIRKEKTHSEQVYEQMLNCLRAGKRIDLDEYQNQVSYRTLYRLKEKALDEHKKMGAHEK